MKSVVVCLFARILGDWSAVFHHFLLHTRFDVLFDHHHCTAANVLAITHSVSDQGQKRPVSQAIAHKEQATTYFPYSVSRNERYRSYAAMP
jgi:hypothetical protein